MATFTSDWTVSQSLQAQIAIANGANQTNSIDLDTLGYFQAVVQVEIDVPSGSPNGDVTIELFRAVDVGSNIDTVPFQTATLNFTGVSNKKRSFRAGGPWFRCKVSNNTGVSVNYTGRYAGQKQVSA